MRTLKQDVPEWRQQLLTAVSQSFFARLLSNVQLGLSKKAQGNKMISAIPNINFNPNSSHLSAPPD